MKRQIRSKLVWGAALLVVFGCSAVSSFAQAGGAGSDMIRIRKKLTVRKEQTPVDRTSVQSVTSARPQDWGRMVVEFETKDDWLDELECTFYCYMKDQSNKGAEVMYRGAVTYMNIPKGRHLMDMFLHPSTLARVGNVEFAAVVIKHRGAVVAVESTATTPNWWERFSPVDGVLLNRSQTPFALLDYDAFNAIKPTSSSAR